MMLAQYDEDDVRDLAHGQRARGDGRRYDNGDDARNRLRNRIEQLPPWARAIEEAVWGTGLPRGGS